MLFVFLVLFPTGALLARYFKDIVGKKWINVCVCVCTCACACVCACVHLFPSPSLQPRFTWAS